MTLLQVVNLQVTRGPFSLRALDLEVGKGEIVGILGPNGAGKSTLLDCLVGELDYTGEIRLQGEEAVSLKPRERAKRVAFVPQRSELRARLTVEEVVAMGRFAHESVVSLQGFFFGRNQERRQARDLKGQNATSDDAKQPRPVKVHNAGQDAVRDALDRLDLTPLRRRLFVHLSVGQQQRVLLARAIATGAPLLLLDEPFAPLDIRQRLEVTQTVRELREQGRGVLLVLHELSRAMSLCDRVLLLKDGTTIASGAPELALTNDAVEAAYGVAMSRHGAHLAFRLPSPTSRTAATSGSAPPEPEPAAESAPAPRSDSKEEA